MWFRYTNGANGLIFGMVLSMMNRGTFPYWAISYPFRDPLAESCPLVFTEKLTTHLRPAVS